MCNPPFVSFKMSTLFGLFFKSQLIFLSYGKFGIILDASASNYFTNLKKQLFKLYNSIFSRITYITHVFRYQYTFSTYINICSFQQQEFQDFELSTVCCIMKRLPSPFQCPVHIFSLLKRPKKNIYTDGGRK